MQIPDVNVLVDAWHPASRFNQQAVSWLEEITNSETVLGLDDHILSSAVRILTSRRIPTMGADIGQVLAAATKLRSAQGTTRIAPGRNHWSTFTTVCTTVGASGALVPDCYIAALAIERKATLVSRNKFFARVPGLKWMDLPGA